MKRLFEYPYAGLISFCEIVVPLIQHFFLEISQQTVQY